MDGSLFSSSVTITSSRIVHNGILKQDTEDQPLGWTIRGIQHAHFRLILLICVLQAAASSSLAKLQSAACTS